MYCKRTLGLSASSCHADIKEVCFFIAQGHDRSPTAHLTTPYFKTDASMRAQMGASIFGAHILWALAEGARGGTTTSNGGKALDILEGI